MAERCRIGLCFNYDEQFTRGHKCKHIFDITLVNDYDMEEADPGLMMMISAQNSGVRGWRTMFLAGDVLGQGVRILINISATHNVIIINFARWVGLMERRINTTILIGSGDEIACWGACFNVPLRIDSKMFQIDAILVDLNTPWMADLNNILLNFTSS